jgi:hypothetical protein
MDVNFTPFDIILIILKTYWPLLLAIVLLTGIGIVFAQRSTKRKIKLDKPRRN